MYTVVWQGASLKLFPTIMPFQRMWYIIFSDENLEYKFV